MLLCRPALLICAGPLEMTPNNLFGVGSKIDVDVSELSSWTMKLA